MTPKRITIHCSDTPDGKVIPLAEIRRWHMERGWDDVGYHAIVQPTGLVEYGRRPEIQGAHVYGENEDNLGLCFIGKKKFREMQFIKAGEVIYSWCQKFDIPEHQIYTHAQFDMLKTCPNIPINNILAWYVGHDLGAVEDYILRSV